MDLFLLLLPAVLLPVGLAIAGLWWLLSSGNGRKRTKENDRDPTHADNGNIER